MSSNNNVTNPSAVIANAILCQISNHQASHLRHVINVELKTKKKNVNMKNKIQCKLSGGKGVCEPLALASPSGNSAIWRRRSFLKTKAQ